MKIVGKNTRVFTSDKDKTFGIYIDLLLTHSTMK